MVRSARPAGAPALSVGEQRDGGGYVAAAGEAISKRRKCRRADSVREYHVTPLRGVQQLGSESPEAVPYLRLSGAWLHDCGFAIGERVYLVPAAGKLVLTIDDPAGSGRHTLHDRDVAGVFQKRKRRTSAPEDPSRNEMRSLIAAIRKFRAAVGTIRSFHRATSSSGLRKRTPDGRPRS